MKRPATVVVGAGRLGTALARRLRQAKYRTTTLHRGTNVKSSHGDVFWFCVPDSAIEPVASDASHLDWKGKYAFHSSGVLSSDALAVLRRRGAHVASVHPLMTFVKGSTPKLAGVPFAIEGDARAVRMARAIVRKLGGTPVAIQKQDKVAYHAFATMVCPLLVSLLAASEKAAALAGMTSAESRRRMLPIIRQTLNNYEKFGPAGAFSGPIVRGDVETICAHLKALAKMPSAKSAYRALASAALTLLPTRNRRQLARLLD